MAVQELRPFPEIVRELVNLCKQRLTGILYLTTNLNHTATVGLSNGQIISLQYRVRRGLQSLDDILRISSASYHFKPEQSVMIDTSLPSTEQLLQKLSLEVQNLPVIPVVPDLSKVAATGVREPITPEQRFYVETTLLEIVGPMAPIMVKSSEDSAINYKDFVRRIAAKIPSPDAAESFLKKVLL
ncbi:MAG: hypothetical protein ACRCYY_19490 [Trueperaceae bacterium]